MSIIRNAFLAGAALALPLAGAQAATIIQTSTIPTQVTEINAGPNLLNGFDSTLGTLTGVTIEYNYGVDSSGDFTNTASQSQNFFNERTYDGIFTFDGPAAIAGDYVISHTSGRISYSIGSNATILWGPENFSDSAFITPTAIDQFIDHDFNYSFQTLTGQSLLGSGGNIVANQNTTGDAYVKVTYTYDEPTSTGAVPEPATWAMLIFGFGAVGLAARRRKTVAA